MEKSILFRDIGNAKSLFKISPQAKDFLKIAVKTHAIKSISILN